MIQFIKRGIITCHEFGPKRYNILTTHSAVVIRSTRLFVTYLITGCRITCFRFGGVSGTKSTRTTCSSKVSSRAHCKTREKRQKMTWHFNYESMCPLAFRIHSPQPVRSAFGTVPSLHVPSQLVAFPTEVLILFSGQSEQESPSLKCPTLQSKNEDC